MFQQKALDPVGKFRGNSETVGVIDQERQTVTRRGTPRAAAERMIQRLKARLPELALLALGIVLRISMSSSFKPGWSYDYYDHRAVAQWMLEHHAVAPVDALRESFHPPLFYALWAVLMHLGVSEARMVVVPIFFGTLRLALIWLGLELYVEDRSARLAALALAAVIAASVHIDGMVYSESLDGFWTALALLLVAALFRRPPRQRWSLALVTGAILALAMLTKISAVVIVASLAITALLEMLLTRRRRLSWRVSAALPLGLTIAVCALGCGWFFARNVVQYHRLFVTSFDLPSEQILVAESNKLPYLGRRSLDFVFGWGRAIFFFPYFASGIYPRPQFFPVAVASSFVDYWNYSFSGLEHTAKTTLHVADGALSPEVLRAAQYGVLGGTVIFAATVVGWSKAALGALRRRAFDQVSLLLVPPLTLLAALHFSIQCPVDRSGVVKGVYMQFGAPVMFAAFGLSVGWARQRAVRWPVFGLLLGALWCVTTYTVYCRLRIPLLPVG